MPQQVVAGLAADASFAEQREVEVTVLFSDIRGFSTLSERLGARDIADVVGRHLSAMAEVIAAHGGTIDKFQGDAVMAVFGAPVPQRGSRGEGGALCDRDAGTGDGAERRGVGRRRTWRRSTSASG